MAEGIQNSR